jgi:hypothetical protein
MTSFRRHSDVAAAGAWRLAPQECSISTVSTCLSPVVGKPEDDQISSRVNRNN